MKFKYCHCNCLGANNKNTANGYKYCFMSILQTVRGTFHSGSSLRYGSSHILILGFNWNHVSFLNLPLLSRHSRLGRVHRGDHPGQSCQSTCSTSRHRQCIKTSNKTFLQLCGSDIYKKKKSTAWIIKEWNGWVNILLRSPGFNDLQ